ncbi:carbohydrate ABC transporter permease [Rhizobium rhizogenes]|uniref:ABC transporter permease n=1 Tax=Rhizobium rhizogenes TaxID=359 RepID=A0AA92BZD7_RHIRH|nr:sugar ABC transporter permease [Rhizobium rhizogenes]PVE50368.1 ABC transporter permease [Rhizobium rhizogenes]PVE62253.1 ABC transporter permease [Agrobacterium tumefaciens]PVE70434.1 ABC transporter permease [Sphingomonas sp. TPD3009]
MTSHSRRPFLSSLGEISETRYWVYLLLLPSLLLLVLVIAYPTIYGFFISVREMRLTRPGLNGWVGMKHYAAMMSDRVFWISLKNTAIWVVAAVTIEMALGFVAALALNRNLPGTKIFGILILLPYFLPNVVAGHMWALLLDPRLGVINDILVRLGILSTYKAWFADPNTALAATILVEAWHGFPFFALLFLAGLKGIPEDLYKAAAVDGAGAFTKFRLITVPMLKTVITAAVILRVISLVNSPDLLLVLTGGGPGNSTQVLSLYAFQTAYRDFNFGYAGALSVVMFFILMVFATIYIRLARITRE